MRQLLEIMAIRVWKHMRDKSHGYMSPLMIVPNEKNEKTGEKKIEN